MSTSLCPSQSRASRNEGLRWLAAGIGCLTVAGLAVACFLLQGSASPTPVSVLPSAYVGKPSERAVRPFYQTLAR